MIRFQPNTRRKTAVALTDERIRQIAPSVFADTPYMAMSDKYKFVPTIDVVNLLRSKNFLPIHVRQSNTRIPGKGDFTRHMITFRQANQLDVQAIVGDEVAEVILVNSHDGTSTYQFHAGIFRFICANGMIVKDSDFGTFKVRHAGKEDVNAQVIDATYQIMDDMPKVMAQINDWKNISLQPDQRLAFAESAKQLIDNDNVKPTQLLAPRRVEDAKPDLWSTMNVVQENALKGGIRTYSPSGRRSTTRPVKDIGKDVRLNKALWALTAKMAELVS